MGLKIDIGCGPNKKPGFVGVDSIAFPGVDVVADIREAWPFKNDSVSEINCSHVLEHLSPVERCHFANELDRVLVPAKRENGAVVEGFAAVIVPHWASCRAYGDPTHDPMPVSEFWFYYLSREWREKNAPHTDKKHWPLGFDCDLEANWGYSMHAALQNRNPEYQQHALAFWKEAAQDMVAQIYKKPRIVEPVAPPTPVSSGTFNVSGSNVSSGNF